MFTALIYLSERSLPFNELALKKLSEKAHQYNNTINITGFLSFKNGIFYQYLEGDTKLLKDLLKKIEKDKRHQVGYKFHFTKIQKRIFNDWGMKYYVYDKKSNFDHDNLVRDILEVISENESFEEKFEMELIENLKYIRKNLHKYLPHLQ